jgi:hypothetical protein
MEETIARIRRQGALVYVAHPLASDVPSALRRQNVEAIIDNMDVVEGFNARILWQADNLAAQQIARQRHIPLAAGSDAHFAGDTGRAGVEVDRCTTPQELLDGPRSGHVFGRRAPYLFSVATCGLWCIDKFREFLAKSGQVRSSPRH